MLQEQFQMAIQMTGESFGGEEGSQFNGLTTDCTQDAAPEVAPAFTTGPTVAAVAGTGTVTDGTDIAR